MNLDTIRYIYFIGIGGIGMSALARYFNSMDYIVSGYDKTSTQLTDALINENIEVHFKDDVLKIPHFHEMNSGNTLVIYTPAVPSNHGELVHFSENQFVVMKRAAVLGDIANSKLPLAVAGTHGKTSVSSMVAHLFNHASVACSAFLGGIAKNFNSNILLSSQSKFVVVEADEYDRSFLRLKPFMAIVTAVDADHLDIYGSGEEMRKTYALFIQQIRDHGTLIMRKGIDLKIPEKPKFDVLTYGMESGSDFYAENIRLSNGFQLFDAVLKGKSIKNIKLGLPGLVNIENMIGAMAVAFLNGISPNDIILGVETFEGVKRRFDFKIRSSNLIYIDDYAHHPQELNAVISSVRDLYPGKKILGIFQPHLFSRTRDFAEEFAKSLSLLNALVLLDIYPARELPIEGVTSQIVFEKVTISEKVLCAKEDALKEIEKFDYPVVLTMGAGDIDKLVEPIREMLEKKINNTKLLSSK